jgi:hypothetical protein
MNLIVSKQELIDIGIAEDKIQELIQLKINNSKIEWQDLLPKIGEEANVFSFSLERKKVDFEAEAEYSFSPKYNISFLAKKIDLFIRMTNFAFIKNDGWEANWNDEKSIKHGLVIFNNKVELCPNFHNIFIFGITFKDKEISKEALDIFGVEIGCGVIAINTRYKIRCDVVAVIWCDDCESQNDFFTCTWWFCGD